MKLSPAMKRAFRLIASGAMLARSVAYRSEPERTDSATRHGGVTLSTLKALESRALIERQREEVRGFASAWTWSITPAGRALLEEEGE